MKHVRKRHASRVPGTRGVIAHFIRAQRERGESFPEKLRTTYVGHLRVSKIFQLRRTSYSDKLHSSRLPRSRIAYSHPLLRDAPRLHRDSTKNCVQNESDKSPLALHPLPIVKNESSLFDAIRKREWNDAHSILENERINLHDAIKYEGKGWYSDDWN